MKKYTVALSLFMGLGVVQIMQSVVPPTSEEGCAQERGCPQDESTILPCQCSLECNVPLTLLERAKALREKLRVESEAFVMSNAVLRALEIRLEPKLRRLRMLKNLKNTLLFEEALAQVAMEIEEEREALLEAEMNA